MAYVYRRLHLGHRKPPVVYGVAGAVVYTWEDYGTFLQFDATKYGTIIVSFEAVLKKTGSDSAKVRLYDIDGAAAVTNSEVTNSSTSYSRERSGALTLSGAKEYKAQAGFVSGSTTTVRAARLIVEM